LVGPEIDIDLIELLDRTLAISFSDDHCSFDAAATCADEFERRMMSIVRSR
jgi:hypothetical protein